MKKEKTIPVCIAYHVGKAAGAGINFSNFWIPGDAKTEVASADLGKELRATIISAVFGYKELWIPGPLPKRPPKRTREFTCERDANAAGLCTRGLPAGGVPAALPFARLTLALPGRPGNHELNLTKTLYMDFARSLAFAELASVNGVNRLPFAGRGVVFTTEFGRSLPGANASSRVMLVTKAEPGLDTYSPKENT